MQNRNFLFNGARCSNLCIQLVTYSAVNFAGSALRGTGRRGRAWGSLVQRLSQARRVAQLAHPVREAPGMIPFSIPVDRRWRQRLITAGTLPVDEVILPLHVGDSFPSVGSGRCQHTPRSQGRALAEAWSTAWAMAAGCLPLEGIGWYAAGDKTAVHAKAPSASVLAFLHACVVGYDKVTMPGLGSTGCPGF